MAAKWVTFECTECGHVEDVDVNELESVPMCDCGGLMEEMGKED